jgi:hypothetical protein
MCRPLFARTGQATDEDEITASPHEAAVSKDIRRHFSSSFGIQDHWGFLNIAWSSHSICDLQGFEFLRYEITCIDDGTFESHFVDIRTDARTCLNAFATKCHALTDSRANEWEIGSLRGAMTFSSVFDHSRDGVGMWMAK